MQNVTAELSLYPLRQPRLSPAIDEALRVLRAHGLSFEPRTMSTFLSGDDEVVFAALREVWRRLAGHGDVVMHVTVSNACPKEAPENWPEPPGQSSQPI